jgi:cytochrome b
MALYAVEEHAGPLVGLMTASESAEEFWEEMHELFGNLTLVLVIVHVVGALVSSYLHRENLVRTVVTGRKAGARITQAGDRWGQSSGATLTPGWG